MMDSEESTNILYRNTIQYLHDLAEKVPNTLSVLKSYYASKFRISELQTKISVEKSKNKYDARCPRCCLKLRDTQPSFFVKPERRKSKFAQKVLKKMKENKRLTKFQAKYLVKNNLELGNSLVVTCNFCKKEVIYQCKKPAKKRIDFNGNKQTDQNKNKKKAKKKKDKLCGLQKEAVASVQIQSGTVNKPLKNNVQNGNYENGSHEVTKNKTVNNVVTKKKEKLKKKKNMINKLNHILNESNNLKTNPKSSLANFLQSLS